MHRGRSLTLLALLELSAQTVYLGQLAQVSRDRNTSARSQLIKFSFCLAAGFLVSRSYVDLAAVGNEAGGDLSKASKSQVVSAKLFGSARRPVRHLLSRQ